MKTGRVQCFANCAPIAIEGSFRCSMSFGQERPPERTGRLPEIRLNNMHPDYHQPSDELSKINWEKMTNIIRLGFLNTWEFANSDEYLKVTPTIDFPGTLKS